MSPLGPRTRHSLRRGHYNGTMKALRSGLSLALAFALVLLSPGAEAWSQAMGAVGRDVVRPAAALPAATVGVVSAPPAAVVAPLAALAPAPALAALPAAPAAAFSASAAPAAAALPAATAFAGIRRALPEFSKMPALDSKGAADADFSARLGETAAASEGSFWIFGSKKKGRTPDSRETTEGNGRPASRDGGVDDLGRPTRSGDHSGPDDRTSSDDQGGGSSTLFSSLRPAVAKWFAKKKSGTPDSRQVPDGNGKPASRDGGIDGLGRPTRSGDAGPDDRTSPDDGGGAAGPLFAVAHAAASAHPLISLAVIMLSVIPHEIFHGKAAAALGDPTAQLEGRTSFNPFTWHRHVDFRNTIVLPLATMLASHGAFVIGAAKPVPIDDRFFAERSSAMAKVAFAGPAANLAMAALGAAAYGGAVAGGFGALTLYALKTFVSFNTLLAVFNLMPIRPLDGAHILAHLAPGAAGALENFFAAVEAPVRAAASGLRRLAAGLEPSYPFAAAVVAEIAETVGDAAPYVPLGLAVALGGHVLTAAATLLSNSLISGTAAAALAVGALTVAPKDASVGGPQARADLIVVFSSEKALSMDLHLASVDARRPDYAQAYMSAQQSLLREMASVGLTAEDLAAYRATPVASYRRINAATVYLEASKADEFVEAMRARGHQVFRNDQRPSRSGPRVALDDVLRSLTAAANDGSQVIDVPWSESDAQGPSGRLVSRLVAEGRTVITAGEDGGPAVVRSPSGSERAPVVDEAAEYRRLAARVAADAERRAQFLRKAAGQDADVREELLAYFKTAVEPEIFANLTALEDFVAAHPYAQYKAAGFWMRLWMRLTWTEARTRP